MFQELMWLGAILAIIGVLVVAYLATLAIRRLIDRHNESTTAALAMPIMASPTNAPISFLNMPPQQLMRLKISWPHH